MKSNLYGTGILLCLLVIGGLSWRLSTESRYAGTLEQELSRQWANDLSGVFSGLAATHEELLGWAEAGQVETRRLLVFRSQAGFMAGSLNNNLNTMKRLGLEVPERSKHVHGFLDGLHRSLHWLSYEPPQEEVIPLSAEKAAEFRRYAELAGGLVAVVPNHYPGWNRGFPQDLEYWDRFVDDLRWRSVVVDMDKIAEKYRDLSDSPEQ